MTTPLAGRALVIGLTIHGLAVARALARAGIAVDAFAPDEGFAPCTWTRYARVHRRHGLNGPALLDHLLAFADGSDDRPIVLFPTSDRMVETIARHWDCLAGRYRVSWSHCRELVLQLQSKDRLAEFAARARVPYPETVRIASAADACEATLPWPVVVKPARPLSAFKALVVGDRAGLVSVVERYPGELPFIAQRCVPGGDGSLYACTLFLDHGRELGHLTSRKLAADPPDTGQGIIFETCRDLEILELSRRFVAGLDLSGPVAIEFKRDPEGRCWLIEPNVARTEYCVDLAIAAGFNLPLMEYQLALGTSPAPAPSLPLGRAWFDTDKAPLCYLRRRLAGGLPAGVPVFPFAGHADPGPLLAALCRDGVRAARELAAGVWHRIRPARDLTLESAPRA